MKKTQIKAEINAAIAGYRRAHDPRTTWKPPLVAYADAADPLFPRLKEVIGPDHVTPAELLPGARTVITYFVPFTEEIPRSNRRPGTASRAWAVAYVETNALLAAVNRHLASVLERQGHAATVMPITHNFDQDKLISDWSHKHVAYIAGLGTFGRHHMLITEAGCCGRLGSLVTTAELATSERPTAEACLYKIDGSCSACVTRCPVGALDRTPFDRHACYRVCLANAGRHADVGLAEVCGKCVSVVPCSFRRPIAT